MIRCFYGKDTEACARSWPMFRNLSEEIIVHLMA
jgi:hypothetical protein